MEAGASKRAIAESFSRAAQDYDSVAGLQRAVGGRLLESSRLVTRTAATVLDLGCGTGHFHPALQSQFPDAHYIGLDLAAGMLGFARGQHPSVSSWLLADAEQLPLANNSVDVIFSSLAIQWCYRPEQLFAELARVLRPGGHCLFSSLGPQTLHELRSAWAAVDRHRHVNDFLPIAALQAAVDPLLGVELNLRQEDFQMGYREVAELLRELKTLGAHNMNPGRPLGLAGRKPLRGMMQAYETFRRRELLPATYEVVFGVMTKA